MTRKVLTTDWGKELYLKRQGTAEPVFGQIKSNRGANRFLRRGRSAVRSEWRVLTATHNLLKLHQHQLAANVLHAALVEVRLIVPFGVLLAVAPV